MTVPDRRTLVSLTFDDALDVHLDTAIPILDGAGVPGTFYVNLGAECFTARHAEWRRAAAQGHELGNHTIFHPGVSSKDWVTEGIAIDHYSLDRMRVELDAANRLLSLVDGRAERSFAFPCSNPWLGKPGWPRRLLTRLGLERTRLMGWVDRFGLDFGSRLVEYTPLVRERFPAARCGGMPSSDLGRRSQDRHRVRAVAGDGETFEALSAAVETAIERNAWLVFVFHGIGGGHHLSCDLAVFQKLVAVLAADARVEVVSFLEGARRAFPEPAAA
jgi:peptidoglycan/xylan/chitin deacetylase (PgdA/CDA1 family)